MEGYNISVIGKSGVGKSSLLNYLFGKAVAKEGSGKPQTKEGFHLTKGRIAGKEVNIYDSWGIEEGRAEDWLSEFRKFQREKQTERNVKQWLHTVIFCISGESKRIQDFEILIIKEIQKEKLIPVVVITKANSREIDEFANKVEAATGIKPVLVCSVEKTIGFGVKKVIKPFGKEKLILQIKTSAAKSLDKRIRYVFDTQIERYVRSLQTILVVTLKDELSKKSTLGYISKKDLLEIQEKLETFVNGASEKVEKQMQQMIHDAQEFYKSHIFEVLNINLASKFDIEMKEDVDAQLILILKELSLVFTATSISGVLGRTIFGGPLVAAGIFVIGHLVKELDPDFIDGIPQYSADKILEKFRAEMIHKNSDTGIPV